MEPDKINKQIEDQANNNLELKLIEKEPKKKKMLIKILVIVCIILIVGTICVVTVKKFSKQNNNENQEQKEENNENSNNIPNEDENQNNEENKSNAQLGNLDINNSLIQNLVYPKANEEAYVGSKWSYKDINLSTMNRNKQMLAAAAGVEWEHRDDNYSYVSASKIRNSFLKVFGPDTKYEDGNVYECICCFRIGSYNDKTKEYDNAGGPCGGMDISYSNEVRLYKAEQTENYIYTYFYVQAYYENLGDNKVYLYNGTESFDYDYDTYKPIGYNKVIQSKNEIQTMMDKGEVDTYKFTFKKQSDGNYYFYSGEWQ